MKMKKIGAALMAGAMCLAVFSGCTQEEKVKIGVVQIVQHASLNDVRDSFAERMKELGYTDENCEIEFQDAQNESSNANSIVQSFKGDKKDIIIAIATSAAQAAANVSDEIPVVFSAITDPVFAGLVDSLDNPGGNMTGTSDALQIGQILDFALELTPGIQKLGYIYNSGEPNSVSVLEEVKAYCEGKGIEVVEKAITNTSEVQQAAQVLVTQVDAVFTPNDNTITVAMDALANAAIQAKVPVYVGADSMVESGGFATIGIDYTDLGKVTADMADQILKGEKKPSEIPVKVFDTDLNIYINKKTAAAIGVTIPDEVANNEKTVFFGE